MDSGGIQTEKLFDIRSKVEDIADTGQFKARIVYITKTEHEFDVYVAININRSIWLACSHGKIFFEDALYEFLERSSGVMNLDELGCSLTPGEIDSLERELSLDGLWKTEESLYLP